MERQHDRKTEMVAATWAFRSTEAGRRPQPRSVGVASCYQQHPATVTACHCCIIMDTQQHNSFSPPHTSQLDVLTPVIMAGKLRTHYNTEHLGGLSIAISRASALLVSPFFALRYSHP